MGEILSFVKYHSILSNSLHPSIHMKKFEFYKSVFNRLNYDANSASVSRWCNGKEPVTDEILGKICGSPETYEKCFEDVFKKSAITQQRKDGILLSAEAESELIACLEEDPLRRDRKIPMTAEGLMAYALTEALVNDAIRKKLSIDKAFENGFEMKNDFCRKNDIPVNTPFFLIALMENKDGTFLAAYEKASSNRINDDERKIFLDSIREYTSSVTHRGTYSETVEESKKILFWAKKYAYLDNRNPASEIDIVRALFLTDSRTLKHLAEITGGKENLIKEMENVKKKHPTTTL